MANAAVWRALLGVEKAVVEDVDFDENEQGLVAHARPSKRRAGRCGRRTLDLGTVQAHLEADAPRVTCALHGPTVQAVPRARHGTGHTHVFDEQVAWAYPEVYERVAERGVVLGVLRRQRGMSHDSRGWTEWRVSPAQGPGRSAAEGRGWRRRMRPSRSWVASRTKSGSAAVSGSSRALHRSISTSTGLRLSPRSVSE